jgi:hypothetical protein
VDFALIRFYGPEKHRRPVKMLTEEVKIDLAEETLHQQDAPPTAVPVPEPPA